MLLLPLKNFRSGLSGRTGELLRLAGACGDCLVLPPAQAGSGRQDCVWMAFGYLRGWRLYSIPGKPIGVFDQPHSNKETKAL